MSKFIISFLFASERVCGLPPTIDFGYLSAVTGVESGDTATYQCIPGFESAGSIMIACQNGKWGSLPACSGKYSFELDLMFSLKLLLRS